MSDEKYIGRIQTSVTNFLYHGDEYLFVLRNPNKRIDPNRLNGIGGRVEPEENYLEAAIRETEEETGYVVSINDIQLSGIVRLEGGYDEDWVMCFFKIFVPTKAIPIGNHTEDGTLLWIHKDKIFDTEHELVDDLNYCMKDVIAGESTFFTNIQLNDKQKATKVSVSKIDNLKRK